MPRCKLNRKLLYNARLETLLNLLFENKQFCNRFAQMFPNISQNFKPHCLSASGGLIEGPLKAHGPSQLYRRRGEKGPLVGGIKGALNQAPWAPTVNVRFASLEKLARFLQRKQVVRSSNPRKLTSFLRYFDKDLVKILFFIRITRFGAKVVPMGLPTSRGRTYFPDSTVRFNRMRISFSSSPVK